MTKTPKLKCSICDDPIRKNPVTGWDQGHNAQPVNDGRCCDNCNSRIVIPYRFSQLLMDAVTK